MWHHAVMGEPYYRRDLSLVHHLGFGFHADRCAPGLLRLLEPILETGGAVLELGCGSGLLTRHLVDAGHRVIATDASPAMLELTSENVPGVEEIRQIVLPDDPLPMADAVVSVGHVLNYLPNAQALERGLLAAAAALRPAGLLAVDVCDLEYGRRRQDEGRLLGRMGENWAIVLEISVPAPDRLVRTMATFLPNEDGSWRRDDEVHDNVLIDAAQLPALLAGAGISADLGVSFGAETLPAGLMTVIGRRHP